MKRQYQKLIVWKEAHFLCLEIYRATKLFPDMERYGLTSQMRRAAVSISCNLAEGNGRRSSREKIRYIDICIGSLEELHYQCILANDLTYLPEPLFLHLDDRIMRVGYLLQRIRMAFQQHSSESSDSSESSESS